MNAMDGLSAAMYERFCSGATPIYAPCRLRRCQLRQARPETAISLEMMYR